MATGNFWLAEDTGQNTLRGLEVWDENLQMMVPDPEYPAVLPADYITEFLRLNKFARMSFNDLRLQITDWTPDEIVRLDAIERDAQEMLEDYQTVDDRFMARQNTAGIYTAGPNGGTPRG
jgi:hypothetical protein